MIRFRISRPEEIEAEQLEIMNAFCAIDPEGDFDEAKWKRFYASRASERLKQYDREVEEAIAQATREGVLV